MNVMEWTVAQLMKEPEKFAVKIVYDGKTYYGTVTEVVD